MYGIYIHDDGNLNYAKALVKGIKRVETRARNVLKGIDFNQRIAIIRTRSGHAPEIVGYVKMEPGFHCPASLFHLFDEWHLVGPGSKFDTDERGKWFYTTTWFKELDEPLPLPKERTNHGRSYTEF